MYRFVRSAVVALSVSIAAPALAVEPTGSLMADAFLRSLEARGFRDVRAEAVTREPRLTLANVRAADADGLDLTIAEVTLTAPALNAAEALTAHQIVYADFRLEDPAGARSTTIGAVTLDDPVLPTATPTGNGALVAFAGSFRRLALTDLSTRSDESGAATSPLTIAALALTVAEPGRTNTTGGQLVIDRLSFAADLLDGDAARTLRSLDLGTVSLDLIGEGSWDRTSGLANLETATVRVADIGTLAVSAELSGLSEEAAARIGAGVSDGAALLEALQAVTFLSLSVAYADDGLAEKLLSRGAERAELDRATYAGAEKRTLASGVFAGSARGL